MRIGGANDFPKEEQCWVFQVIFFEEGIERHIFSMVSQFAALNVERRRVELGGLRRYLVGGHENKLGFRIDELFDEPGTCHPVHLYLLARNPFHNSSL